MSKTIKIKQGIAVPFRIGADKRITVSDFHYVMEEKDQWGQERMPGRPKMAFHLKESSESERKAAEIVKNSNLSEHERASLVSRMSQFFDAAIKLNNHIRTPSGNVDISVDSVELRNLWHLYLFRGRELLDAIGKKINVCFALKEKVSGLNARKFAALQDILARAMRKREDLQRLAECVENYKNELTEFIELRNTAKERNDTLVEPPVVSPPGIPRGGKIVNRINNKEYVFVDYFYSSFTNILEFARTILG